MTDNAVGREATSGPAPRFHHRLAIAYRFIDVFTGAVIAEPLRVTIPGRNWSAYRSARDYTYRFLVSNGEEVPAGVFDVEVAASGREYLGLEPIQAALPVPPIAHPPPVVRADYLVEAPLWPTRAKTLPAGETAVVGRIVSSGGAANAAGLRLFLFEPPGPAPATPYAWTDGAGDFLFRLPSLKAGVSGGVVVSDRTLNVGVFDGAVSVAVTPNTITLPLGRVSTAEFDVA